MKKIFAKHVSGKWLLSRILDKTPENANSSTMTENNRGYEEGIMGTEGTITNRDDGHVHYID